MSAEEDDAADRAFEQRARAELRRTNEQVPPDVRAGLDRIVERALLPPRPRRIGFALPVAAVAALAGIFVMQQRRPIVAPAAATAASDDFVLLIDGDNLDLLEQMEFYEWLDRQPGILDESAPGSAQRS